MFHIFTFTTYFKHSNLLGFFRVPKKVTTPKPDRQAAWLRIKAKQSQPDFSMHRHHMFIIMNSINHHITTLRTHKKKWWWIYTGDFMYIKHPSHVMPHSPRVPFFLPLLHGPSDTLFHHFSIRRLWKVLCPTHFSKALLSGDGVPWQVFYGRSSFVKRGVPQNHGFQY